MLAPRNPSSPPLRQATLVARSLGHDRGGRTVLADVSLTVGPGTRLGVIGPNGTGKSTLLQLLAGILKPDDGSVTLDPPSATVGYLAQEHEAVPGRRWAGRWPAGPAASTPRRSWPRPPPAWWRAPRRPSGA